MTIDSLAQVCGMTVRTLRSHASRGLLPPPIMQGRVGYYNGSHLARITFIKEMQSAGFSLSSIEQILSGVPDDADLRQAFELDSLDFLSFVEQLSTATGVPVGVVSSCAVK